MLFHEVVELAVRQHMRYLRHWIACRQPAFLLSTIPLTIAVVIYGWGLVDPLVNYEYKPGRINRDTNFEESLSALNWLPVAMVRLTVAIIAPVFVFSGAIACAHKSPIADDDDSSSII